jgi:hypothetical protein
VDGGIFGDWITDRFGLPAFRWQMNQRTDPRASWPNSEDIPPLNITRKDHFQVHLHLHRVFMLFTFSFRCLATGESTPWQSMMVHCPNIHLTFLTLSLFYEIHDIC